MPPISAKELPILLQAKETNFLTAAYLFRITPDKLVLKKTLICLVVSLPKKHVSFYTPVVQYAL